MKEVVDYELENLINLNGYIVEISQGYWIKIEARRVKSDFKKPHGIKYSLSLPSPEGERILGFDNAHSPPNIGKNADDYIHKGDNTKLYDYQNPSKLLDDFFIEVNKILTQRGVK